MARNQKKDPKKVSTIGVNGESVLKEGGLGTKIREGREGLTPAFQ